MTGDQEPTVTEVVVDPLEVVRVAPDLDAVLHGAIRAGVVIPPSVRRLYERLVWASGVRQ